MDEQDERAARGSLSTSAWSFPVVALALAVLVGVGWVVLRPDDSAVGIPVATASVTEPSDRPSDVTRAGSITITLAAGSSMPYQTARFEVLRSNDELDITVSFRARGDRAAAARVEKHTSVPRPWWYAPDKSLQVALIPGYAKNVTSLAKGAVQVAYLASVDLAVVTIERDPTSNAEDFFWSDNAGAVYNNRGDTLASATVAAGMSSVTVFEDAGAGVWGYFDGSGQAVEPIAAAPIGTLRVTSLAEAPGPTGFRRLNWLGLLPVGATDPDLTTDDSVAWGSATLGASGRLAIAGYNEVVTKKRTGVRSITYTDPSGQRRTVRP